MKDVIYDVEEIPKAGILIGLSFQHLFAMFGATVLVPILVGIDPSVALLSSGLGTLAHLSVTKFKIPAYMGSSFAYIAAMQLLMKTWISVPNVFSIFPHFLSSKFQKPCKTHLKLCPPLHNLFHNLSEI